MAGAEQNPPTPSDQERPGAATRPMSGMVTGRGHLTSFLLVPETSELLGERLVNRYSEDALVVSSSLPDRPTSDRDGNPVPTQSSAMLDFLDAEAEQARRAAEERGEALPALEKRSYYLTKEDVWRALIEQTNAQEQSLDQAPDSDQD